MLPNGHRCHWPAVIAVTVPRPPLSPLHGHLCCCPAVTAVISWSPSSLTGGRYVDATVMRLSASRPISGLHHVYVDLADKAMHPFSSFSLQRRSRKDVTRPVLDSLGVKGSNSVRLASTAADGPPSDDRFQQPRRRDWDLAGRCRPLCGPSEARRVGQAGRTGAVEWNGAPLTGRRGTVGCRGPCGTARDRDIGRLIRSREL